MGGNKGPLRGRISNFVCVCVSLKTTYSRPSEKCALPISKERRLIFKRKGKRERERGGGKMRGSFKCSEKEL